MTVRTDRPRSSLLDWSLRLEVTLEHPTEEIVSEISVKLPVDCTRGVWLIGTMNFAEQLRRQIRFLERSSIDFDRGHAEEALRMAVSLRVLIHDTANSTSLLTHLGIKSSARILSTFEPIKQQPGLLVASVPFWVDSTGQRQAPLEESDWKQFMQVTDWWTQLVMTGNSNLSRKDTILAAANQDGGAHVDANPNKAAQELIRGVGTHTLRIGNTEHKTVLDNHHFYLIRQFAYEVLNSPDIASRSGA